MNYGGKVKKLLISLLFLTLVSVLGGCERTELHVVLVNLNTHKPKHDRWLARHPDVHFHYLPIYTSWLNQVEVWFSVLSRQALRGLNATSVKDICRAIDAFTDSRNEHPFPFEWTKSIVNPVSLNHQLTNLCN